MTRLCGHGTLALPRPPIQSFHMAAQSRTPLHTASPEFLTLGQLAERWQVSEATIYRLMASGELVKTKIGTKVVRFARTEVERFETCGRVDSRQPEWHA